MCLFSGPVEHVSGTRIYAGPRDGGTHQRIAYTMTVDVPDSLAMVLPIPTPPSPAEDAVKFVDLSAAPKLFDDLDLLFPVERELSFGASPLARAGMLSPQTLVVHDVGDFEASFVPTLREFSRLDERFRLPDDVWSKLPQYADWSFCVFKLRAEPKPKPPRGLLDFLKPAPPFAPPKKRHPMAFDFPRRNPNELFFPTIHVHDGAVHENAHFDHTLYAQLDASSNAVGWERASMETSTLAERSKQFVLAERPMFRRRIDGQHPNRDITLKTATIGA